jgi:hypothetical protein
MLEVLAILFAPIVEALETERAMVFVISGFGIVTGCLGEVAAARPAATTWKKPRNPLPMAKEAYC